MFRSGLGRKETRRHCEVKMVHVLCKVRRSQIGIDLAPNILTATMAADQPLWSSLLDSVLTRSFQGQHRDRHGSHLGFKDAAVGVCNFSGLD